MPGDGPQLTSGERATLLRAARSRHTPHGVATRARIVVDCCDVGIAEAARRASVSPATAAKWRRRYHDGGVDGLHDIPSTGRPPIADDVVRRILSCTLEDPPDGAERWTTRAIATATGVSQATVSRTRRRFFPRSGPGESFLDDHTAVLVHVGVHPSGSVLGLRAAGGTRAVPASPARTDAFETILCAALNRSPTRDRADAVEVLRRAAERLPSPPAVTLVTDVTLDAAARNWVRRHPGITVRSVTGDDWFGLLHRLAGAIDPGQHTELQEIQQLIRLAGRDDGELVWSRNGDPPSRTAGRTPPLETEAVARDLAPVVQALCDAIGDGELHAAEPISVRRVARRSAVSPGRVAEALDRLVTEAIIDKQANRYLLPAPTPRDVAETYTARGLLGTAITRRLASASTELPPVVEDRMVRLVRCHELGLMAEACSIDLDLQDDLARAAAMPRIGSMFVRLTLQLRLFLAIFGLSYRYPTDEIVVDDRRIIAEIRRHDPESAVEAWRSKIDNCARYMLARLGPTA